MKKIIFYILFLASILYSQSPFAGGDGSAFEPYLISTPEQLDSVRGYVDGTFDNIKYFKLTANINMDGYNWTPIDSAGNDTGDGYNQYWELDGDGYAIMNLADTINVAGAYSGLFVGGYGVTVSIKDVIFWRCSLVVANATSANRYVALVMPRSSDTAGGINVDFSDVKMKECYLEDKADANALYISLIVADGTFDVHDRLAAEDCEIVVWSKSTSGTNLSMLISSSDEVINESWATGTINYARGTTNQVPQGGFITSLAKYNNCYAIGTVIYPQTVYPNPTHSVMGSLAFEGRSGIGYSSVDYKDDDSEIYSATWYTSFPHSANRDLSSYYVDLSKYTSGEDTATYNTSWSPPSVASTKVLTDSAMKAQSTFDSLDFNLVWGISTTINDGYPYLINNQPGISLKGGWAKVYLPEVKEVGDSFYDDETLDFYLSLTSYEGTTPKYVDMKGLEYSYEGALRYTDDLKWLSLRNLYDSDDAGVVVGKLWVSPNVAVFKKDSSLYFLQEKDYKKDTVNYYIDRNVLIEWDLNTNSFVDSSNVPIMGETGGNALKDERTNIYYLFGDRLYGNVAYSDIWSLITANLSSSYKGEIHESKIIGLSYGGYDKNVSSAEGAANTLLSTYDIDGGADKISNEYIHFDTTGLPDYGSILPVEYFLYTDKEYLVVKSSAKDLDGLYIREDTSDFIKVSTPYDTLSNVRTFNAVYRNGLLVVSTGDTAKSINNQLYYYEVTTDSWIDFEPFSNPPETVLITGLEIADGRLFCWNNSRKFANLPMNQPISYTDLSGTSDLDKIRFYSRYYQDAIFYEDGTPLWSEPKDTLVVYDKPYYADSSFLFIRDLGDSYSYYENSILTPTDSSIFYKDSPLKLTFTSISFKNIVELLDSNKVTLRKDTLDSEFEWNIILPDSAGWYVLKTYPLEGGESYADSVSVKIGNKYLEILDVQPDSIITNYAGKANITFTVKSAFIDSLSYYYSESGDTNTSVWRLIDIDSVGTDFDYSINSYDTTVFTKNFTFNYFGSYVYKVEEWDSDTSITFNMARDEEWEKKIGLRGPVFAGFQNPISWSTVIMKDNGSVAYTLGRKTIGAGWFGQTYWYLYYFNVADSSWQVKHTSSPVGDLYPPTKRMVMHPYSNIPGDVSAVVPAGRPTRGSEVPSIYLEVHWEHPIAPFRFSDQRGLVNFYGFRILHNKPYTGVTGGDGRIYTYNRSDRKIYSYDPVNDTTFIVFDLVEEGLTTASQEDDYDSIIRKSTGYLYTLPYYSDVIFLSSHTVSYDPLRELNYGKSSGRQPYNFPLIIPFNINRIESPLYDFYALPGGSEGIIKRNLFRGIHPKIWKFGHPEGIDTTGVK